MIWWFYRQLKAYRLAPSPVRAAELRARFDRIFKRRTGYATLDRLLKRLNANKDELLRVLERPEIGSSLFQMGELASTSPAMR